MSLIVSAGRLARDMWSPALPRLRLDGRRLEDLREDEVVEDTFEGVNNWGYARFVEATRDRSRRYLFLLANPPAEQPGVVFQASFRIQGYVHSATLGPLGNWKLTQEDAVRAEQRLILCSGGDDAPFAAQVRTLNHVRNVIFNALRHTDAPALPEDKIFLQRRVFTKVVPGQDQRSVLQKREDPTGMAAKICHMWIVADRLSTCKQDEHGAVQVCNHMEIRRGDFVDVTMVVDIVTPPGSKKMSVRFCMTHVVRLRANALQQPVAADTTANLPAVVQQVVTANTLPLPM